MTKLVTILGCSGAILTLIFAIIFPLKIFEILMKDGFGKSGLTISPLYTGGERAFTVRRLHYQLDVFKPVFPALIGRGQHGFIQLIVSPTENLPDEINESVEVSQEEKVSFDIKITIPRDKDKKSHLTVVPHTDNVVAINAEIAVENLFFLAVRGRNKMFVRIPLVNTNLHR